MIELSQSSEWQSNSNMCEKMDTEKEMCESKSMFCVCVLEL